MSDMKRKILLFIGVSAAFFTGIYLVFLAFDLISGTPRENEGTALKFAAIVGALTSFYMVFFTKFFERSKK